MDQNWIIWIIAGYVAGSVPFGLLIGLARGVDVRKSGSGNLGTTNVGRVLGRQWGILCFVLDVLKGTLPVVGAGAALGYLGRDPLNHTDAWKWLAVAAAAVLGHVFPIWLKFRGGKGVATSLGVLLGFWPTLTLPGIAAVATWIVVVLIWRYVSLASIAAAIALLIYLIAFGLLRGSTLENLLPFLFVTTFLVLLVIVRHRSNIGRLLAGTENKVGKKPA